MHERERRYAIYVLTVIIECAVFDDLQAVTTSLETMALPSHASAIAGRNLVSLTRQLKPFRLNVGMRSITVHQPRAESKKASPSANPRNDVTVVIIWMSHYQGKARFPPSRACTLVDCRLRRDGVPKAPDGVGGAHACLGSNGARSRSLLLFRFFSLSRLSAGS